MIAANPVAGVALHAVGALSSASCYTPQKLTRRWAWEIYWISQASFAWLILPILGAMLTVPGYFDLLAECPRQVMLRSFGLGVLYGFGGLTFGLGIRYIGFSLNYAIAIGISAILGTLVPLVWKPNEGFVHQLGTLFDSGPGLIVFAGILLAVVGIFLCGYAGALRERLGGQTPYIFRYGVPLAIVAGILSSVFNFALLAGEPLAKAAQDHGAAQLLSWNAIYPFSNGGAWVTNVAWCLWLMRRNKTAGQLFKLPRGDGGRLSVYYLMALLSGAMWYFQFFFYGMGHQFLGKFDFTSWVLHMAMLILFSNIYGKLFREWHGASAWPRRVVHYGMLVIVLATAVITYGNDLAEKSQARTADIPFQATLDAAAVCQQDTSDVLENGLIIGNGDIHAIVYVADGRLILRMAKNDVGDWRYDSSKDPAKIPARRIRELGEKGRWQSPGDSPGWRHHPYPCPLPCGTVELDLSAHGGKGTLPSCLDLRRAVVRIGKGGPYENALCTVRALADRNVFLIESQVPADLRSHKVAYLEPMTAGQVDGVRVLSQQVPAGTDWPGMTFAVALAEQGDLKAAAIVTTLDDGSKDPTADAVRLARQALAEGRRGLIEKHEADWRRFWSASGIQADSAQADYWNQVWYRNLYFLRTVSQPGKACIGLFAGLVNDDKPAWHGAHTMNYNCQQTFWGAYAANHLELVEPYWRLLKDFEPSARWLAKTVFESPGLYIPHDIWTFNNDANRSRQPGGGILLFHPWGWSLGLTGWCVQNAWWWYTYDPNRQRLEEIYPMLKGAALLYADLIEDCPKTPDGKVRLGPSVSSEHFGWRPDLSVNYNLLLDILYARWSMQKTIEAARRLDRDSRLVERLQKLLPLLPDYPTWGQADQRVVVDVPGVEPHVYNIPLPAFPVFPANQVTVFSPPARRRLMERSIARMQDNGNNALIIRSIAMARLSMPGTLETMTQWFKQRQRPNGTLKLRPGTHRMNDYGHYTEMFAATAAVSELFLQSVGGIIRVFPAWPSRYDARFVRLRAEGGFLVSADQKGGKVVRVEVQSTAGRPLRLLSPWPALTVNGKVQSADERGIVTVDTRPGRHYVFLPAADTQEETPAERNEP